MTSQHQILQEIEELKKLPFTKEIAMKLGLLWDEFYLNDKTHRKIMLDMKGREYIENLENSITERRDEK